MKQQAALLATENLETKISIGENSWSNKNPDVNSQTNPAACYLNPDWSPTS